MARHVRTTSASPSSADASVTPRQRRTQARTEKAEQRRLAEREQISGEIRTPEEITARRADRHKGSTHTPSKKTPVSARTLVPERTFSGRMIVLTIVTLVVISFLVPTVRSFMQQRAEITELSEQIAAEEQLQEELYSELARWDDPQFVQQQARQRLNLVMPGERRYHVIGGLDDVDVETDSAQDTAEEASQWTDELWDSVVQSAEE